MQTVLAISLVSLACGQTQIREETHWLTLGDDRVALVEHAANRPGLRYVVLHDDENTAVEAALEIVRTHGGTLFELRHSGARNVRFTVNGGTYHFDPNRIFTPVGAARTLERWSELTVEPPIVSAVRTFADSLVAVLTADYDGLLVAVHNNTDDGYSVLSYQAGGDLSAEARFVHVAANHDTDDFFFATTDSLYSRARAAGFHAVLQRMPVSTDDGSLSVWAAQNRVPYVNVEAEHDHLQEQIRMLETVVSTLAAPTPAP